MYAHINGIVAEKNKDSIVLEAGGVGYLLLVSGATLAQAPAAGEKMKLYTVLNVREDAMELCGFATKEEKQMYEKLRSVSGIGSRSALNILSALSVRDLTLALLTGDVGALTKLPGIGKKIAQRLVNELGDKLDVKEVKLDEGASAGLKPASSSSAAEAIAALVSLGYSNLEATKAVAAVESQTQETDKMIFLALRGLGG